MKKVFATTAAVLVLLSSTGCGRCCFWRRQQVVAMPAVPACQPCDPCCDTCSTGIPADATYMQPTYAAPVQ